MAMTKKVVFTGGGTAGHVLPNIALIKKGLQRGWQVSYLGSKKGIEHELIGGLKDVRYYSIATGKLRRYFSWQNFIDLFKVGIGILQSIYYLHKISPSLVFSKGGYVGLPVTVAAWLLRIPVVVHESDLTVGLANRLAFVWASRIALSFEQIKKNLPAKYAAKSSVTGMPIREEFVLLSQNSCGENEIIRQAAKARYWLPESDERKPLVVIFGGSLGALKINEAVRAILPQLLVNYRVLHVCGQKGVIDRLQQPDYQQFEYINELFPAVLYAADIVIARAGATTIYELMYLAKPHILIPLDSVSSRGDQLINARYFADLGCSVVIEQQKLVAEPGLLLEALDNWRQNPKERQQLLDEHRLYDGASGIITLMERVSD